MSKHQHLSEKCKCHKQALPAQQTLTDMEFDRGIWNAAIYNDLERVREFITKGHTMNRDNCDYTPLHYAARCGHEEVCQLLINEGHADVNAITKGGVTPLHRASMKGQLKTVKLLIDAKANLTIQDSDGLTPLHRAAMCGHWEVCKLLLENEEKLKDIEDNKERTAYEYIDENADDDFKLLLKPQKSNDNNKNTTATTNINSNNT